jgi:diguanylate cyclase (GGDEF)-like protein
VAAETASETASDGIGVPAPPVAADTMQPDRVDPAPVETPPVAAEPVATAPSAEPAVDPASAVDRVSGLPGPVALRARVEALVAQRVPFVLVLADVDELARINRDLGHAVGDDAIRALASTLATRGGPESFAADRGDGAIALVCPGLTLRASVELLEGVRCDLLDRALLGATTAFTCSYGITHSRAAADAEGIISLAAAGVRRAKDLGGDEIVYADETLSPTS